MDTETTAAEFVWQVLEWRRRGKSMRSAQLAENELETLVRTVRQAGFEIDGLRIENLFGDFLDQDGSRTGETYPINELSPFTVMSGGREHFFATGWLDCAVRRTVFGRECQFDAPDELARAVAKEIERSRPLEPIRLTADGDRLLEYPRRPWSYGLEYFVDHVRDHWPLKGCVGTHEGCGWVDRRTAGVGRDALLCRGCSLRVPFPKTVQTYGELRQFLEDEGLVAQWTRQNET